MAVYRKSVNVLWSFRRKVACMPLLVLSNFKVGLLIVRLSKESNTSESASWKKCLVDIFKAAESCDPISSLR